MRQGANPDSHSELLTERNGREMEPERIPDNGHKGELPGEQRKHNYERNAVPLGKRVTQAEAYKTRRRLKFL